MRTKTTYKTIGAWLRATFEKNANKPLSLSTLGYRGNDRIQGRSLNIGPIPSSTLRRTIRELRATGLNIKTNGYEKYTYVPTTDCW